MKIGILAPIEQRIPVQRYGGIERIVDSLTEGLVANGHNVTLFATSDSHTSAELIASTPPPHGMYDRVDYETRQAINVAAVEKAIGHVASLDGQFDILHDHTYLPWLTQAGAEAAQLQTPVLTTLHEAMSLSKIKNTFEAKLPQPPVVSVSDAQRELLPQLNYIDTVHNGIDINKFTFNDKPGDYLAFLGRLWSQKGPCEAIEIAKLTGRKLKIAGLIGPLDQEFFNQELRPHIDGEQIEYIGEIGGEAKDTFLGNAYAILSPLQGPEAFGLIYPEAMATGTPVISVNRGPLPEIVVQGRTGFLCESEDAELIKEMADCVERIDSISRADCREHVEEYFSAARMVAKYVDTYRKVLNIT